MSKYLLVLAFSVLFFQSCTSAPVVSNPSKLLYNYGHLKLMDIDDMTELVEARVNAYKETNDREKMIDALTVSLSRPNEDDTAGRLVAAINRSAESDEQWQDFLKATVERSITALSDRATSPEDQVTFLVLLQNWLSEVRPQVLRPNEAPFERTLVQKIADANIEVSVEADRESSLNLMTRLRSPSVIATEILKSPWSKTGLK
jgi:hypothetical protein